jgi:signal transduction histidine kinase
MRALRHALTGPATYRRLLFMLSALVLGPLWFSVLVAGWSMCAGFAITPLVIPLLIGLALITRAFAAAESALARALLGIDAHGPAPPPPGRFWMRFRALLGPSFWRAQAYLLIRWLIGFPLAVALLASLVTGLGLTFAPAWVPFVHGGAHLGFWRPHTFVQSLALLPLGLALLLLIILLIAPITSLFVPIVSGLLSGTERLELPADSDTKQTSGANARQQLKAHGAVDAVLVSVLVLIWALTSRGYFWPIWVALPLALALAIHGWIVLVIEYPTLRRRFRGSRALAVSTGVAVALGLFQVAIWTITGAGYFWPIWPIIGIAISLALQAAAVVLWSPGEAELTERIETLESTRAGAVDVQESDLRRIERDLHDGAQARLVALGMSLGMAEQKLADDPETAGELLAEARVGAQEALRELRDLARGIHPPVLGDRGLQAAIASLVSSAPMQVNLSVDVAERPPSPVESAAYFVVSEALANAAKHAHPEQLEIRIARIGDVLEVEVEDDGVGGADPRGTGLAGLRQRVEALDGRFLLSSPPGGPTRLRAEIPCG